MGKPLGPAAAQRKSEFWSFANESILLLNYGVLRMDNRRIEKNKKAGDKQETD
jgi:hypothetical protein